MLKTDQRCVSMEEPAIKTCLFISEVCPQLPKTVFSMREAALEMHSFTSRYAQSGPKQCFQWERRGWQGSFISRYAIAQHSVFNGRGHARNALIFEVRQHLLKICFSNVQLPRRNAVMFELRQMLTPKRVLFQGMHRF